MEVAVSQAWQSRLVLEVLSEKEGVMSGRRRGSGCMRSQLSQAHHPLQVLTAW